MWCPPILRNILSQQYGSPGWNWDFSNSLEWQNAPWEELASSFLLTAAPSLLPFNSILRCKGLHPQVCGHPAREPSSVHTSWNSPCAPLGPGGAYTWVQYVILFSGRWARERGPALFGQEILESWGTREWSRSRGHRLCAGMTLWSWGLLPGRWAVWSSDHTIVEALKSKARKDFSVFWQFGCGWYFKERKRMVRVGWGSGIKCSSWNVLSLWCPLRHPSIRNSKEAVGCICLKLRGLPRWH